MSIINTPAKPAVRSPAGYPPLRDRNARPPGKPRSVHVRAAQQASAFFRGLGNRRLKSVPSLGPRVARNTRAPELPQPPASYFDPMGLALRDRKLPQAASPAPIEIVGEVPSPAPALDVALPAKSVPTRQQFVNEVRAPERDSTFLGFTIRRRDTPYKRLLASLDAFHAVADGKPASLTQAQALRAALEEVKQSVEGFVADMRNTESDRNSVRAQVLPLQRELAVLDRAIRRIKSSPEGLPADLQKLCTQERAAATEIFSMVRGPGSAFTELNAQGAVRHGLTPELARSCATRSPERAAGMKPLGKGAINTVYLAKVGLPDNPDGFFGVYKRNSESVDEASLAAGISEHRPTSALRNLATWRLAQRLQLDVIPQTHLVLNGADLGCILERAAGVSPMHTGNRQVPVSPEVAERLRDDPALLKSFAMQKGYVDASLDGTTVQLIMESTTEALEGTVYQEFDSLNPVDFGNSALRRELTRLQWLDALTGQCDRHAHNYFVERTAQGGVHVRGIDNDMAFGAGVDNPDKLPGDHSPRLPTVIDRATADLLRGLEPEELEELCAGLAPQEIESARQRLNVIKARIALFEQPETSAPAVGRVLEADADWSTPEVSKLLGVFSFDEIKHRAEGGNRRAMNNAVDAAFATSYVARDHATQVEARKGFSAMPVFDAAELQKDLQKLGPPGPGDTAAQATRALT